MSGLLLEIAFEYGMNAEAVCEFWAERAAIREFMGNQERAHAEAEALAETREYFARLAVP